MERERSPNLNPTRSGRIAKGKARLQLIEAYNKRQKRPRIDLLLGRLAKHAPRLAHLLQSLTAPAALTSKEEQELAQEFARFAAEADKAEALLVGSGRWLLLHDDDNQVGHDDDADMNKLKRRRMSFREEARLLVDIRIELRNQLDELLLQPDMRQQLSEFLLGGEGHRARR